jgi:predicted acetyltransferase
MPVQMATEIRELLETELEQAWRLGQTTFGHNDPVPDSMQWLAQQATQWGAFEQGVLVGKATDLHHEQLWDGGIVPASGVAGVSIAPEFRSRGIGLALVQALSRGAHDRGVGVATLFCTTSSIYRALGWESVGSLRYYELPTSTLSSFAVPNTVTMHAGTAPDLAEVRAVYRTIAQQGNGMLLHHHIPITASSTESDGTPIVHCGVTLARDQKGHAVGYAHWQRGRGYGDGAILEVPDLIATTPDAAQALLAVLGSWASVTPMMRFRHVPVFTPIDALIPWERCRELRHDVWMHRVVDLGTALTRRGWPSWVRASASFRLVDELLDHNSRSVNVVVEDGVARVESRRADAPLVIDVRGWALLWCGITDCHGLRAAGMLEGVDAASEQGLNALFRRSQAVGVLDYF